MSVIPVTVFFSLGLVFFFVALFLREHRRRLFASAERDSLLPLATERPRVAGDGPAEQATKLERSFRTHSAHESRCGCARGERPPCSGCAGQTAGHSVR